MAAATARVLDFPEAFDLDALIRQTVEESDIADPHQLAEQIAGLIPDSELRAVVGLLLPDRVRNRVNGSHRFAGRRIGSAKWLGVAESAQDIAIFRERVCVKGAWKFLGECSRDDVAVIAGEYRELAEANARRAESF